MVRPLGDRAYEYVPTWPATHVPVLAVPVSTRIFPAFSPAVNVNGVKPWFVDSLTASDVARTWSTTPAFAFRPVAARGEPNQLPLIAAGSCAAGDVEAAVDVDSDVVWPGLGFAVGAAGPTTGFWVSA
jgi:hypothetical protein